MQNVYSSTDTQKSGADFLSDELHLKLGPSLSGISNANHTTIVVGDFKNLLSPTDA